MRTVRTLLTVALTLYGAFVPLQVCHAAGHGAGTYCVVGVHSHEGPCEAAHDCDAGCPHGSKPAAPPAPGAATAVPHGQEVPHGCCVDTRADVGTPRVAAATLPVLPLAAVLPPRPAEERAIDAPRAQDRIPRGVVGVVLLR